jgi:hypothetical protein
VEEVLKGASSTDEKTGCNLHDRPEVVRNTATTIVDSLAYVGIVGERWPKHRPTGILKRTSSVTVLTINK